MKWVTCDHVHLDRVASPWLIKRFVDRAASFEFVPLADAWACRATIPPDAIPFAIPGVELGPHDREGSTFRKILVKYDLASASLSLMAEIIESGIAQALGHDDPNHVPADLPLLEGVGIDAIAQGMIFAASDDTANIEKSMIVNDALYAYCCVQSCLAARPELRQIPVLERWRILVEEMDLSAIR